MTGGLTSLNESRSVFMDVPDTPPPTGVPEPATVLLVGFGLAGAIVSSCHTSRDAENADGGDPYRMPRRRKPSPRSGYRSGIPTLAAITLLAATLSGSGHTAVSGTLTTVSPSGASPSITINITGTGFDATASNNEVAFVPAAGPVVTARGTSIAVVNATTGTRRLAVPVPGGLASGPAALRVTNLTTNEVSEGLTIDIVGISPQMASAPRGTSNLSVRILGHEQQPIRGRHQPGDFRCRRDRSLDDGRIGDQPGCRDFDSRDQRSGCANSWSHLANPDSGTPVGIHRHGCWDAVEPGAERDDGGPPRPSTRPSLSLAPAPTPTPATR